jgi:hypothetical protein
MRSVLPSSQGISRRIVCRAENVLIFFADLFGLRQVYNVPGVVNDENWSLRLPAGYQAAYWQARREGRALNLPGALATALRARGDPDLGLIQALEQAAGG